MNVAAPPALYKMVGFRGGNRHQSHTDKRPTNIHPDLRQTTLTQIDFVSRIIPPELDLEQDEARQSPPQKRRRLEEPRKRSAQVTTKTPPIPSRSSDGEVANASIVQQQSECRDFAYYVPDDSEMLSQDRRVPYQPSTPVNRRRTIVPSSQSPDGTPISIHSGIGDQSRQIPSPSPIRLKSSIRKKAEVFTKLESDEGRTPRPSSNNGCGHKLDSLAQLAEDAGGITPLHLTDSESLPEMPTGRNEDLRSSPNMPSHIGKQSEKSQKQAMRPPPKPFNAIPSSQATTQLPSQMSNASSNTNAEAAVTSCDTDDKSGIKLEIDSQSNADGSLPHVGNIHSNENGASCEPQDSGFCLNNDASSHRVRSSQASTVEALSSGPGEVTPRARHLLNSVHKQVNDQLTSPEGATTPSAQRARNWQWDGKELTESQLLPESLINWSIPLPSSLSSQGSLDGASSDAENAVTHPADDDEVSDFRIKEEPSTQIASQNVPRAKEGSSFGMKKSRVRIKKEPES